MQNMSMRITIRLSDTVGRRLAQAASDAGVSPSVMVRELLAVALEARDD